MSCFTYPYLFCKDCKHFSLPERMREWHGPSKPFRRACKSFESEATDADC